jgi:hypothetical protein
MGSKQSRQRVGVQNIYAHVNQNEHAHGRQFKPCPLCLLGHAGGQKALNLTDCAPWQGLVPRTDVLARHHDDVRGHSVSSCVAIVATALDTDDARNEVDHVQEDELMQARRSAKPCSANTEF